MLTWIPGKIISIKHWTDQLFSIVVHAAINTFEAGQFAKIGIKVNNKIIQRAYSYLNSPNNPNLEFYITKVISGKLTVLLHALHLNDTLIISKESYGRFVLNEIPNCLNLWMIASGTGISPYLSILESHDKRLNQFFKIILIHATRYSKNLNYLFKMIDLQRLYKGRLLIQTILSQERSSDSLYGRIPDLIDNGLLEKKIGLCFNKKSHVMLCGNPHMILDTRSVLNKKYGMKLHTRFDMGHISQERYW